MWERLVFSDSHVCTEALTHVLSLKSSLEYSHVIFPWIHTEYRGLFFHEKYIILYSPKLRPLMAQPSSGFGHAHRMLIWNLNDREKCTEVHFKQIDTQANNRECDYF